jgi:hypothetical protein
MKLMLTKFPSRTSVVGGWMNLFTLMHSSVFKKNLNILKKVIENVIQRKADKAMAKSKRTINDLQNITEKISSNTNPTKDLW